MKCPKCKSGTLEEGTFDDEIRCDNDKCDFYETFICKYCGHGINGCICYK